MRSIRAGKFQPNIQYLTKLANWLFTVGHYQYVRWISVHLRDKMTLPHLHLHMLAGLMEGHFTVTKMSHWFSNLAIDQTYEQHNVVVKDDGTESRCPAEVAVQRT